MEYCFGPVVSSSMPKLYLGGSDSANGMFVMEGRPGSGIVRFVGFCLLRFLGATGEGLNKRAFYRTRSLSAVAYRV